MKGAPFTSHKRVALIVLFYLFIQKKQTISGCNCAVFSSFFLNFSVHSARAAQAAAGPQALAMPARERAFQAFCAALFFPAKGPPPRTTCFSGVPEKLERGRPNCGLYYSYLTLFHTEKQAFSGRLFGPKRRQGAACTASLPSIAPQAAAAPQMPSNASANPTKTGVPPAAPVQSCHTSCGRPQQAQK